MEGDGRRRGSGRCHVPQADEAARRPPRAIRHAFRASHAGRPPSRPPTPPSRPARRQAHAWPRALSEHALRSLSPPCRAGFSPRAGAGADGPARARAAQEARGGRARRRPGARRTVNARVAPCRRAPARAGRPLLPIVAHADGAQVRAPRPSGVTQATGAPSHRTHARHERRGGHRASAGTPSTSSWRATGTSRARSGAMPCAHTPRRCVCTRARGGLMSRTTCTLRSAATARRSGPRPRRSPLLLAPSPSALHALLALRWPALRRAELASLFGSSARSSSRSHTSFGCFTTRASRPNASRPSCASSAPSCARTRSTPTYARCRCRASPRAPSACSSTTTTSRAARRCALRLLPQPRPPPPRCRRRPSPPPCCSPRPRPSLPLGL